MIMRRHYGQASVDRYREWNRCCQAALGYPNDDDDLRIPPFPNKGRKDGITLVNLVPEYSNDSTQQQQQNDNNNNNNNVQSVLHQLQEDLDRTMAWLAEKQWIYAEPSTSDDEASLIQSTLSSYTVTTANELERLRQHYTTAAAASQSQQQQQQQQHDLICIQILSERLKEGVAEPLARLQKQRKRDAVQIWQEPLSCRFVPVLIKNHSWTTAAEDDDDEMDRVLGLSSSTDPPQQPPQQDSRRFVRQRPLLERNKHEDFLTSYAAVVEEVRPRPPSTLCFKKSKTNKRARPPQRRPEEPSNKKQQIATGTNPPSQQEQQQERPPVHNNNPNNDDESTTTTKNTQDIVTVDAEQLQQEAVLVQAARQTHDLDAVHSMETQMVQITALLSQFSELVSEQQDDVLQIHGAVASTKDHMEKGQEQLVDAQQRAAQSKHYMASLITAMGVALWFFHWIRP